MSSSWAECKKCLNMDKWKLRIRKSKLHVCRAVGDPQILADTLTLFKTGGHAHHIITYLHGFQTFLRLWYDVIQWCRKRGGQGARGANKLTLCHSGRADYPHLLLLAPPMFFTFRHHCRAPAFQSFNQSKCTIQPGNVLLWLVESLGSRCYIAPKKGNLS